jgi:hypothetical protein
VRDIHFLFFGAKETTLISSCCSAEQERQTLALVERHVYTAPQTFQSFEGLQISRIAVECVHMFQGSSSSITLVIFTPDFSVSLSPDADVFRRNDTRLFNRTIDAMQTLAVRPPDSLAATAFWLSTVCGAAHLLRLRNLSVYDPRGNGVYTGELNDEGSPFSRKLKAVSCAAYAHLIRLVCNVCYYSPPSLRSHQT